jgi:hypothetical protein
MRKLVAFRLALEYYKGPNPNYKPLGYEDESFTELWLEELAKLPDDKTICTNRDIWETFIREERCTLHEHAGGRCWRTIQNLQAVGIEKEKTQIKSLL